ncbi:MAG: hypothetical protein Q8N17_18560, partial [Burkholderiaceae bacterium]|nr:hypothetical protein [Burkholderiaceae bacterium]
MSDPKESLGVSQFETMIDVVRQLGKTPPDPLLVHLPGWTRGQLLRALKRAVREKTLQASKERGITFYAIAASPTTEGGPATAPASPSTPAQARAQADTMLTQAIRARHPLQRAWSVGQHDLDGHEETHEEDEG